VTNLIPFSEDLARSLVNSDNQFPVNFDDAWQWIGYTRKERAFAKLKKHFQEDVDFCTNYCKTPSGGRPSVLINLTIDCFKSLGMMAGTEQGKQIRAYFLECERTVKEVIPAQSDRLEELRLVNENLRMQLEWANKQDQRIAFHGLPVALFLEGRSNAVVEVEKPTIEIIDEQHNVSFKGQTLKQLAHYLSQTRGITFKSGADLKRALVELGRGDLIAQTKRSVIGDYIPQEFITEAVQILSNGTRQGLIGE